MGRGNLAEEVAAAIGLPSPEQQQETIRQLQPRASWQPPIKDDGTHIDEQDIVDVLVIGSGFCDGRFRIQEYFSAAVRPTVKEQADWLKKEYGVGGRTWDFRDGERGFLDYDAKGLRIKRYVSDDNPGYFRLLPWKEVARRLHLLVHNDQYLGENNKQAYEKWEAEQQAIRDARQAEIDYAEVGNEEYLHQMALAVSVEVCGRLGLAPPADAADRLNGLRAHIPAGEERRALEEVREMAKVFGDTVCKELDLQRPRSDLQRTEER